MLVASALLLAVLPPMSASADPATGPSEVAPAADPTEYGTSHQFSDLEIVEATQGSRHMPESEIGVPGGALLFQNAAGVGESITFSFDVPADGEHWIAVRPILSSGYGIYDVAIDDETVTDLNFYAPGTRSGGYQALGTRHLDAGTHTITFEATGQDEGSSAYFMALSALLLLDEEQLGEFQGALLADVESVRSTLDEAVSRIPGSDADEDQALRDAAETIETQLADVESAVEEFDGDHEAIADELAGIGRETERFADTVDARAARPDSPFGIATADSMGFVYPEELPCETCTAEPARLSLAQGEHESLQTVLLSYGEEVSDVRVTAATVEGPGEASGENLGVTVEPLGSVLVQNTDVPLPAFGPRPGNWEGWITDPIRSDLSAVDVPAWTMQPHWVEVQAGADAAPGEYTVTLEFASEGNEPETLELSVEVWPFEIPAWPLLEMSMTTKSTSPQAEYEYSQRWWMLEQVYEIDSQEEADELRHAYIDFLGEFKIEPDLIYNTVPPTVEELKELEERIGLRQFNVLYLPGYDEWEDDPSTWQPQIDELMTTVRAAMAEYEAAGLADRAYIYGFDERADADLARAVFGAVKEEFPDLPIMSTFMDDSLGEESGMDDLIDIWVPGVNHFDHEAKVAAQERGEKVYWYTHQAVRDPHPNWFNGYPPSDTRVLLGPLSHKMGVDGFLYYNIMRWVDREPMTDGILSSWDPQTYSTSNGDGSLFYPGADGPLASQRLQNYRDGMEDFNLLSVLATAVADAEEAGVDEALVERGRAALDADAVATDEQDFTKDPAAYRVWRDEVAAAITALHDAVDDGEREPSTWAVAPTTIAGRDANAWGRVDGEASVSTQVRLPNGEWATSQTRDVREDGSYVVPLTYGRDSVGTLEWRVRISHADGTVEIGGPMSQTRIARATMSLAPATVAGRDANAWGTVAGRATVSTQVRLPDGSWSTSQSVTTGTDGSYVIPLTYGRMSAGALDWRVRVEHENGLVEYGDPLTQVRVARPSSSSAGSAPVGREASVWGSVGVADAPVWTEVYVGDGRWVRSQQATSDGRGGYVIPLTYGQDSDGTYQFRVATRRPDAGVVYGEEFTFVRTVR